MRSVEFLYELIDGYLEQIELLKAQEIVDKGLINTIMYRILGLAIELNDKFENEYRDELERLESIETITISDELLKRERILELSQRRDSTLNSVFNINNKEEAELYELFNDIRQINEYETVFHESDVQLVKEQLELVDSVKEREMALLEELQNNNQVIAGFQDVILPFEEFIELKNKELETFIEVNEIDKINVEDAMITKYNILERQELSDTNIKLMETAKNINPEKFQHLKKNNARYKIILEEANELLFMVDLGEMLREEVTNYEKLSEKMEKISAFVEKREKDLMIRIPNLTYPNEISYRTMYFMGHVDTVQVQIIAEEEIELLTERNNEINNELETMYDNIKGRVELDNIINNKKVKSKEEINDSEKELNDSEHWIGNVVEKLKSKKDEMFKPLSVKKAKSSLLSKLKKNKEKLLVIATIAGSILLNGKLPKVEANVAKEIKEDTAIEIMFDDKVELSNTDEILSMIVETEEKIANISHSIGDKVNLANGTGYFKDAISAQTGQSRYEIGLHSLRAEQYNVNRIAIMEVDRTGFATGRVLAVNATPGVSAEEIAESMGLSEDQYESMLHIGHGDDNGDYVEANAYNPSNDDLCWLNSKDTGIKVVKPASEVLKEKEGGMTR